MNLVYLIIEDATGKLKATFTRPKEVTLSLKEKTWKYKNTKHSIGDSRNYRSSEEVGVPIGVYDLSNIDHVNRMLNDACYLTMDLGNPDSFVRN